MAAAARGSTSSTLAAAASPEKNIHAALILDENNYITVPNFTSYFEKWPKLLFELKRKGLPKSSSKKKLFLCLQHYDQVKSILRKSDYAAQACVTDAFSSEPEMKGTMILRLGNVKPGKKLPSRFPGKFMLRLCLRSASCSLSRSWLDKSLARSEPIWVISEQRAVAESTHMIDLTKVCNNRPNKEGLLLGTTFALGVNNGSTSVKSDNALVPASPARSLHNLQARGVSRVLVFAELRQSDLLAEIQEIKAQAKKTYGIEIRLQIIKTISSRQDRSAFVDLLHRHAPNFFASLYPGMKPQGTIFLCAQAEVLEKTVTVFSPMAIAAAIACMSSAFTQTGHSVFKKLDSFLGPRMPPTFWTNYDKVLTDYIGEPSAPSDAETVDLKSTPDTSAAEAAEQPKLEVCRIAVCCMDAMPFIVRLCVNVWFWRQLLWL